MTSSSEVFLEDSFDVTQLLDKVRKGDADAREQLFASLLTSMRQTAKKLIAREAGGNSLQTTDLVNEAYIQLEQGDVLKRARDRRYVYGATNKAMKQILINHARARAAQKRGGDLRRTALDEAINQIESLNKCSVQELTDALNRLEATSPHLREVVELRFFAGLTVDEAAIVIERDRRTVQRYWTLARAILYRDLHGD